MSDASRLPSDTTQDALRADTSSGSATQAMRLYSSCKCERCEAHLQDAHHSRREADKAVIPSELHVRDTPTSGLCGCYECESRVLEITRLEYLTSLEAPGLSKRIDGTKEPCMRVDSYVREILLLNLMCLKAVQKQHFEKVRQLRLEWWIGRASHRAKTRLTDE